MSKSGLVLRFRDLVTDEGGTIAEHRAIIRSSGSTWWGWMMRPSESVPRQYLCEIHKILDADKRTEVFVFDTGLEKIYRCSLVAMAVAPDGTRLGSPEPELTPEYYNRGRYPAWFCFASISDYIVEPDTMVFDSFPTKPQDDPALSHEVGRPFMVSHLHVHDVTLWAIRMR